MGSTCGVTIWAIWPKTAWKLQNQHFWGKTVGGYMGGQANFLGSKGDPPQSTPTRGNSRVLRY